MNQLMVDIETFSLESNAIVASIGGVIFKLNGTTGLGKSFEVFLNTDEQEKRGRVISASTFEWWLEQSDAARNKLLMGKKRSVEAALRKLNKFCRENYVDNIWGNGNMFDCQVLRSLYKDFGVEYPVSFRNDLDLRTVKRMMQAIDPTYKLKWLKGVEHCALDDAKSQANVVVHVMKRLKQ